VTDFIFRILFLRIGLNWIFIVFLGAVIVKERLLVWRAKLELESAHVIYYVVLFSAYGLR